MLKTNRFRKKTLAIYSALLMVAGAANISVAALSLNFDEFKANPAALNAIKQSDQVGAVLEVNRQQTMRTPVDIGQRRLATIAERMSAEQAVQTTKDIVQALEDVTLGKGLSPTMACNIIEEKQTHTVKQELSSQVRTAISQSNAAMHFSKDGDRRAMRAKQHYENYCDITEVAQGACLASGNTRGGMDTDYSNIHNNLTLTDEQIDAGYGFMHNIIDPAKSDYSFCDTLACEAISQTEAQYHALGSMVQNTFLNQLQDSIAYDTPPGGAKTITVEQKGALSEPWDGRLARWGETVYVGGGSIGASGDVDIGNLTPKKFSGFDPEMDRFIREAAQRFGVDEKTLRGFIKMEDGWYGKISPTGATGPGQFVVKTWNNLAKTKDGKAIGMQPVGGCKGKPCDPRRDRRINTLATALLMKENAGYLRNYGLPTSPENLYMVHNMGPTFVAAMYGKARLTEKHRIDMRRNGAGARSPEEFIKYQKGRFMQHYVDANQPGVYNGP